MATAKTTKQDEGKKDETVTQTETPVVKDQGETDTQTETPVVQDQGESAAPAKINETVTESNPALKEASKLELTKQNRRTNGYPPSVEAIEEAEQVKGKDLGGKRLTVRTVRKDGNMLYFAANKRITHEEVRVPDSSWLQMQIAAGKIEVVED